MKSDPPAGARGAGEPRGLKPRGYAALAAELAALKAEHRGVLHDLRVHQVELESQNEELRQALDLLEESRNRFADLYDSAPVGYATVDELLQVLEINRAGAALLGVEPRQLVGKPFTVRVAMGDRRRLREHLRACLGSGERAAIEIDLLPRGRPPVPVEIITAPLLGPEGRRLGCRLILTDIAGRRRAEAERARLLESESAARARAEAAVRARDEFLAMVSHELRTPLAALITWTEVLRSPRVDEAMRARAVKTLGDCARAQSRLIEDLLDIARGQSGKLRIKREPLDLEEVVRAGVEMQAPLADQKGVRLRTVVERPTGPVSGDPGRLQQVVMNLVANAVEWSEPGSEVVVGLEPVSGAFLVTVQDQGAGISPAFLPEVFEPFRQEGSSETRAKGGLGLGLAIVRELVELHGGTVRAESEGENRGARFSVLLPRAPAGTRPALEAPLPPGLLPRAAEEPAYEGRLDGVEVLVVDDDEASRAGLALLLEQHGARVRQASSVAGAVESFGAARPDIILSDIAMPLESGHELLRRLDGAGCARAGIPAVALTARSSAADIELTRAAGFHLHLAKPVDPARLLREIGSLVSRPGAAPR